MLNCSAVVCVPKISNISDMFPNISRDVLLNWDLVMCSLYMNVNLNECAHEHTYYNRDFQIVVAIVC